jgi:hypothetical protein
MFSRRCMSWLEAITLWTKIAFIVRPQNTELLLLFLAYEMLSRLLLDDYGRLFSTPPYVKRSLKLL